MDSYEWPKITDIAAAVQSKKTTAKEQVEQALSRIEKFGEYHAVLSVLKESALASAEEIDKKILNGEKVGRLAGVPFIAKDNFLSKNGFTTAASKILEPFHSPIQATAIEKLESEGAILVAKANLDAFAHGSSTENSAFGPSLNPHDKSKVPGGSSGGSGVAVALSMVPFALGTDTGGSIRLPASYCGVVGLKPTYGLVSRYGVVAMASSTDVIGPLTKRVEDAALVLEVMSGQDRFDSTTIKRSEDDYSKIKPTLKGKKIGVIKEYFSEGLDDSVSKSVKKAIKELESAGAVIKEISLPSIDLAWLAIT
jgi:aspartyl-tRNA(Asn)/glutamyl-tRNA(Gln) amidotransferase subunit A